MLKINNVSVKTPSRFVVSIQNIGSKVDRNAAGKAVIDRVSRKRRLDLQWKYLTNYEANTILDNSGRVNAFFDVEYYDPEDNANRTITCYMENIEIGMHRYTNDEAVGWEDVRIELMER